MQQFVAMIRSHQLQGLQLSDTELRKGFDDILKKRDQHDKDDETSLAAQSSVVSQEPTAPLPIASPLRADECSDSSRAANICSLSVADNQVEIHLVQGFFFLELIFLYCSSVPFVDLLWLQFWKEIPLSHI